MSSKSEPAFGCGLPTYHQNNRPIYGYNQQTLDPDLFKESGGLDRRSYNGIQFEHREVPNQPSRLLEMLRAHIPDATREASRRFHPYDHGRRDRTFASNYNRAQVPGVSEPSFQSRGGDGGYSSTNPISSLFGVDDELGTSSSQARRPGLFFHQPVYLGNGLGQSQNHNKASGSGSGSGSGQYLPEEKARERSVHTLGSVNTMGYPSSLSSNGRIATKTSVPIVAPVPQAHAAHHRDVLNSLIEASERPQESMDSLDWHGIRPASSVTSGAVLASNRVGWSAETDNYSRENSYPSPASLSNSSPLLDWAAKDFEFTVDADLYPMEASNAAGERCKQILNMNGGASGREREASGLTVRPVSPATLIALTEPFLMSWCFDDAEIERLAAALEN